MKRLIAAIAVSGFALALTVGAAVGPLIGNATPAFADTSEPLAAGTDLTDKGVFVLEELDYELPIATVQAKRQNRSVVTSDITDSGVFVLEGPGTGAGISALMAQRPIQGAIAVTDRGVFVLEERDYELSTVFAATTPERQNPAGWSSELTDRGVFVLEDLG